jgi:hypothetical protein
MLGRGVTRASAINSKRKMHEPQGPMGKKTGDRTCSRRIEATIAECDELVRP